MPSAVRFSDHRPVVGAIYSGSYRYNIPADVVKLYRRPTDSLSGDGDSLRGRFLRRAELYIGGGSYAATQSGIHQMDQWGIRSRVHCS